MFLITISECPHTPPPDVVTPFLWRPRHPSAILHNTYCCLVGPDPIIYNNPTPRVFMWNKHISRVFPVCSDKILIRMNEEDRDLPCTCEPCDPLFFQVACIEVKSRHCVGMPYPFDQYRDTFHLFKSSWVPPCQCFGVRRLQLLQRGTVCEFSEEDDQ